MVTIGCISYTNSVMFYHGLAEYGYELRYGTPSELVRLMERGEVAAGLLPIAGIAQLGERVVPLANFGIACTGAALSVIVFSNVKLEDAAARVRIGVTEQTVTSYRLLRLLSRRLWQREANTEYVAADAADKDAVLLIGDDALSELAANNYRYQYDLGAEWGRLTGRPFVFARWAAASDLADADREALADSIGRNLEFNLAQPEVVLAETETGRDIPSKLRYIRNFRFIMSKEDIMSADYFIGELKEGELG